MGPILRMGTPRAGYASRGWVRRCDVGAKYESRATLHLNPIEQPGEKGVFSPVLFPRVACDARGQPRPYPVYPSLDETRLAGRLATKAAIAGRASGGNSRNWTAMPGG
jgi:hypothetical protein